MAKSGRGRAMFRNAVMWGVAWGALGTGVTSIMRLTDGIPLPNAIGDGIGMGIRIGVMGAIVGALFSVFIALAYRGKRLREISALRFGMIGALLIGLFIPLFLQSTHLIAGEPLVPWNLLFDDLLIGVVFGGIVAGGSMKLAQRAADQGATDDADLESADALDAGTQHALGSGRAEGFAAPRREGAPERSPRSSDQ